MPASIFKINKKYLFKGYKIIYVDMAPNKAPIKILLNFVFLFKVILTVINSKAS